MIYIHFIVNPISGNGNNFLSENLLRKILPESEFKIEVDYTQYKKHAIDLTQKIIKNNPDYIIACGGDGTVNEIASCLVGKIIKLGIIPLGSGNGLAAHLLIPKNIEKAIKIIKQGKYLAIDIGKVNESYFFNCFDLGVSGMLIKKYEESGIRMRKAYAIATVKSIFQFKETNMILNRGKIKTPIKPYLLFISNINQMGYKLSFTPKAKLQDGYLDLIVLPELSYIERITLLFYLFLHKIDSYKKAERTLIRNLTIDVPKAISIEGQIDGEIYHSKTNTLSISVVKNSLNVITNYKEN